MHSRHAVGMIKKLVLGMACVVPFSSVQAYELYNDESKTLNADLEAGFGAFHSDENYNQFGNREEGSSNWTEGYIKYGLSGSLRGGLGELYGKASMLSSATWGDGDSAGYSEGDERTNKIEDASVGWRSGDVFGLGKDFFEISTGRQLVPIGDGFLVAGDGVNYGNGPAGGGQNRGGGYYLSPRKAFDKTAVLKVGGHGPMRSTLAWLKSDNLAQASTEFTIADVSYNSGENLVAATWAHGLNVDEDWASPLTREREGMDIYSVRAKWALVDDLVVSGNYAYQDRNVSRENAWYVQGEYTFNNLPWTPTGTYRYTRYSDEWDSFFYGYTTGYGTWFQGENAASYAGPYNTNTQVQHVGLKVYPSERLKLGALYFNFDTLDKVATPNFGGDELDLFVEWLATDNIVVTPLVGIYKPKVDAGNGGVQLGNDSTMVYAQFVVYATF